MFDKHVLDCKVCVSVACSLAWEAAEAPSPPSRHLLIRGCTGPPRPTKMIKPQPQVGFSSNLKHQSHEQVAYSKRSLAANCFYPLKGQI